MTFIASVIAKSGVALIADSLVTSSKPVLEYEAFLNYVKTKMEASSGNEIKIDPKEISGLFKSKASHTKDYEEKLFEYDKYTAITTAGAASINGERISLIIEKAKSYLKPHTPKNMKVTLEEKVELFRLFIEKRAKEHLAEHSSIRPTTFIFTHFQKSNKKTIIYKIEVVNSSQKDLSDESYNFVVANKQAEHYIVVCDGQNRISERILFGEIDTVVDMVFKVANKVAEDFGIDKSRITPDYLQSVLKDKTIMSADIIEDIKISKLTELSLQQAVDLARLLMKIEIDIQKYTENIPTVGGVIKIAIIDEKGFQYIAGNKIFAPETV